MTERPILFSGPMVRAILEGRKTQTRRQVKAAPSYGCPYGKPGDRLWVRETWQYAPVSHCYCPQGTEPSPCDDWLEGAGCSSRRAPILYAADGHPARRWRPSIFMPRWASRITLEIVSVRVERLSQISAADAYKEGCNDDGHPYISPFGGRAVVNNFASLWQSINGPGTFDNRWVWVVEFKVLEGQG